MSPKRESFVYLCLQGRVLAEEIDDFVDMWHEGGTGLELHEYLGMDREEYRLWVEKPNALSIILEARKRGGRLSDYKQDADYRMAARADSQQDAEDLILWLKQTGRLPSDA